MEKNYYQILEIDKNASPEIIKKAYTTLAKKYHPDLQENPEKKQACENILKQINVAYEVLSNEEKRKEYDLELLSNLKSLNNSTSVNDSSNFKNEPNNIKRNNYSNINYNSSSNQYEGELLEKQKLEYQRQQKLAYERQMEQARKQAYYDAYIQDLKNKGYKIKYKKTFKDYIRSILAVFITLIILFIIYQIPFVKHHFENLYKTNYAFKFIIDFFSTIITSFFMIFKGDI